MTVKEYLEQARTMELRIRHLILEIRKLKVLSRSLSTISLERDHVTTSSPSDSSFARILAKVDEKEEQLSKEMDRLLVLREQIMTFIHSIPNSEAQVILISYYVDCLEWKQIGELVHMHRTSVRRYHDRIIEQLSLPDDAIEI